MLFTMNNYKKRILDRVLERRFRTAGAILLEGIKWCGKTTTCEQLSKSAIYMDEPEKPERAQGYLRRGGYAGVVSESPL